MVHLKFNSRYGNTIIDCLAKVVNRSRTVFNRNEFHRPSISIRWYLHKVHNFNNFILNIPDSFFFQPNVHDKINFRCKVMDKARYHCGPFDFDGFATDSDVYPTPWKASMFFISLGFFILTLTVLLTLLTCCRQSLFGKSIHNIAGSAQVVSGKLSITEYRNCQFIHNVSRYIGYGRRISASSRLGSEEGDCNVWHRCRSFLYRRMFDR